MAKDILYPEVKVQLRMKGVGKGPITVEDAKQFLGWVTEEESKVKFGDDYFLKDLEGNKVRLNHNDTNRPFRRTLAMRWANEILRKKWKLNGETLIFDRLGMAQSAQHRLIGLVFAEQLRKKEKDKWAEYWKGPVNIEGIIVVGIEEHRDTVDTIDLGGARTLADVLFRNREFGGTEDNQEKLARTLAIANRLVWLRVGGKNVSDAPHFPHSEALEFLEYHPELLNAVRFIEVQDSSADETEKNRISSLVSKGYAAALMYLMAVSKTNPDKYDAEGEINLEMWDKAEEFWEKFAEGSNLSAGDPILMLRKVLTDAKAGSGEQRDELVGKVVKAWNAFVDGVKIKATDLKLKREKHPTTGKFVLAEDPRIGGLDVVREKEVVEEPAPEPKATKGKGRSKKAPAKRKGIETVEDADGEVASNGEAAPSPRRRQPLKKAEAATETTTA